MAIQMKAQALPWRFSTFVFINQSISSFISTILNCTLHHDLFKKDWINVTFSVCNSALHAWPAEVEKKKQKICGIHIADVRKCQGQFSDLTQSWEFCVSAVSADIQTLASAETSRFCGSDFACMCRKWVPFWLRPVSFWFSSSIIFWLYQLILWGEGSLAISWFSVEKVL